VDQLLDVAVESARRAGALLLQGLGSAREVATKSSATDMVSEMDRAAEAVVRAVINERRPGDTILGEEGGEVAGTTDVRWIVDPLDGTTNFLYGIPMWAVSVAAEKDGAVVAGAVFDPIHRELWTAVRGQGAALNGSPLPRLTDHPDLATALVATGFEYGAARRGEQGKVVTVILPEVRDVRRCGAAALDMCWVGAGRVDAYYETGTHNWDRAAGLLVAAEAGAWVGGFDGGPPVDEGVLAANPALAAPMQELLARAGAGGR
jgi:myo-inositol-1(or 4)-monophosphatase